MHSLRITDSTSRERWTKTLFHNEIHLHALVYISPFKEITKVLLQIFAFAAKVIMSMLKKSQFIGIPCSSGLALFSLKLTDNNDKLVIILFCHSTQRTHNFKCNDGGRVSEGTIHGTTSMVYIRTISTARLTSTSLSANSAGFRSVRHHR